MKPRSTRRSTGSRSILRSISISMRCSASRVVAVKARMAPLSRTRVARSGIQKRSSLDPGSACGRPGNGPTAIFFESCRCNKRHHRAWRRAARRATRLSGRAKAVGRSVDRDQSPRLSGRCARAGMLDAPAGTRRGRRARSGGGAGLWRARRLRCRRRRRAKPDPASASRRSGARRRGSRADLRGTCASLAHRRGGPPDRDPRRGRRRRGDRHRQSEQSRWSPVRRGCP